MKALRTPNISTRWVTPADGAYRAALRLRHQVFYEASGMPLYEVPDALEPASLHLIAENDGEVCGYGRLTLQGDVAQISQMVVEERWRRHGVGRALIVALIKNAQRQSIARLHLSAQLDAVAFYRRFGFVAVGNPQPSARLRIPVQTMELDGCGLPSNKAFEQTRRSSAQDRGVGARNSTPGRNANSADRFLTCVT